jgi:hypothetical protein
VVFKCLLLRDEHGNLPPQISLLFWRALCEMGTGARFFMTPVFNYYLCNMAQCNRDNAGEVFYLSVSLNLSDSFYIFKP